MASTRIQSKFHYNYLKTIKGFVKNNTNPLATVSKWTSYLKPRQKTKITLKYTPHAPRDQWCLIECMKYGLCAAGMTATSGEDHFIADIIQVSKLDSLLRSEEALCRTLHLYILRVIPTIKAIRRKLASHAANDRTVLMDICPELMCTPP